MFLRNMPKIGQKKIIIGLTGNIAAGKSTVAQVWQKMGAVVINVDKLAHELYLPQTPVWKKIVKTFGKEILKDDHTVDRRKLAAIVFRSDRHLTNLNKIMFPSICQELKKRLRAGKGDVIVGEMAVLFEAKAETLFDKVVLVNVSQKNQLQRLLLNSALSLPEAKSRLKSLLPHSVKIAQCDYVLDGNKPKKELQKAARKLLKTIVGAC